MAFLARKASRDSEAASTTSSDSDTDAEFSEETEQPSRASDKTGEPPEKRKLYSEEIRSQWNFWKMFNKLGTLEQCIEFAINNDLILRERYCNIHRTRRMSLKPYGQLGTFACVKHDCKKRFHSRAARTCFENSKMPMNIAFLIMYMFCIESTYEQVQKETVDRDRLTVLSWVTVAKWYNLCRETVVLYELENQEYGTKIGGPNKVIQVFESKFEKRKHNKGRHIEGQWVIGLIEESTGDLRLELCPDDENSAAVLVQLIKKHVQQGSILNTDSWKPFNALPQHGYVHKKCDHSDHRHKFVAPDGTHTQPIKSQWKMINRFYNKSLLTNNFSNWLVEYSWRRKVRVHHKDIFAEFIKALGHVYSVKRGKND